MIQNSMHNVILAKFDANLHNSYAILCFFFKEYINYNVHTSSQIERNICLKLETLWKSFYSKYRIQDSKESWIRHPRTWKTCPLQFQIKIVVTLKTQRKITFSWRVRKLFSNPSKSYLIRKRFKRSSRRKATTFYNVTNPRGIYVRSSVW